MLQQPDKYTKRILDLADFIETLPPERFSMGSWGNTGEPRCICGWLLHREGFFRLDDWHEAGDRLGLDELQASKLFTSANQWNGREAARVLRHLAITGELVC
jgi:hypothetical protein